MINGQQVQNQLLAQTEQKIEDGLTPENKANYMKAVVAGMKAGMAGGNDSVMASLKDSKDPIRDCAIGAINLSLILRKQSRDTMPVKCMIPAAMTLMLKGLGFAEQMGLVKVGAAEISQATKIFSDHLMACFKITPQMMQSAIGNVSKVMSDPASVQKMRQYAEQNGMSQTLPQGQAQ